MDILVGLVALVAGAAVAFAGLRLFKALLPFWGFILGFLAGAAGVSAIFGDNFLSGVLGFIVGLIVGVVFAAIAYLWWYIGVLVAAGGAGSVFGASLFATLGIDNSWLLFFIGLAFGALFVVGALVLNFPVYLVIASTAISGAAIAIGGVLLIFNRIDREDFSRTEIWGRIDNNWYLWLIWAVLAVVGIGAQLQSMRTVMLPEERWTRAY